MVASLLASGVQLAVLSVVGHGTSSGPAHAAIEVEEPARALTSAEPDPVVGSRPNRAAVASMVWQFEAIRNVTASLLHTSYCPRI